MAFLDETGLAELWSLVRSADVKIETGSYVGTGKYGESNPNSITFSFAPKMVFMLKDKYELLFGCKGDATGNYRFFLPMYLMDTTYKGNQGFTNGRNQTYYGKRSEDGKTLYWYHDSTATAQLNSSVCEYYYLAIG